MSDASPTATSAAAPAPAASTAPAQPVAPAAAATITPAPAPVPVAQPTTSPVTEVAQNAEAAAASVEGGAARIMNEIETWFEQHVASVRTTVDELKARLAKAL
jgi:alpha/beta superfamily hydrolase